MIKDLELKNIQDIDIFDWDYVQKSEYLNDIEIYFKKITKIENFRNKPKIHEISLFLDECKNYLLESDNFLNVELETFYVKPRVEKIVNGDKITHKFISKINHGFWEQIAFLLLNNEESKNIRSKNYNLLEKRYFSTNSIFAILASIYDFHANSGYLQLLSLTSGVAKSEAILQKCRKENNIYSFDDIRRGTLVGLILAGKYFSSMSHSDSKNDQLHFSDSYALNLSYQDGTFLNALKTKVTNVDTALLFIGPKHISKLKMKNVKCGQFYLALSENLVMENWLPTIVNIISSIEKLFIDYGSVTILFQGYVLSPMVASYLNHKYGNQKDISFYDLGRLMDIEVNQDLAITGSPLPNNKLEPTGFFELLPEAEFCFVQH